MRWSVTTALAVVLVCGLACSGGEAQTSAALPPTTKVSAGKKLSKTLDAGQTKAAKAVAAAKSKNGKPSADGTKKLQVERKKKKEPSGEIVWVIVEEWVEIADWHDEIWVIDAFIDGDDVLLVELDDFDDALIDEIVSLEVEALEEALAVEIVGAVIEEAVGEAIVEEVAEQLAQEQGEAEEE